MENNIITPAKIPAHQNFLGQKTRALKKCLDDGFSVPPFVAISSKMTGRLLTEKDLRKKIIAEIFSHLKSEKYAVRSSALIEDGETRSFAGQFLTKTNLDQKEIEKGILEVLRHAKTFLGGNLDAFSLIVQKYIKPEIFGVTFTRNPDGNREMIVEYARGDGEKIVGGKISPRRIALYKNEKSAKIPLFLTPKIIESFWKIERENGFPQDIEWGISKKKLWIFQTRKITTISPEKNDEIQWLEKILNHQKKYFFEKTKITETAPRPWPATLDLLQKIYAKNGPVAKVYQKYRLFYRDTHFLKIIGNELYVDREKELKSLLPAYSFFSNRLFIPKISGFRHFWKTIKNLFFLNTISPKNAENLFLKIKTSLESQKNFSSARAAAEHFLDEYETIFEVNFLAEFLLKRLSFLLKKEPISALDLLENRDFFLSSKNFRVPIPKNIRGNSLDFGDETAFAAAEKSQKNIEKIKKWEKTLPKGKRKYFRQKIKEALSFVLWREYGRWLTVKNANFLREKLLHRAKKYSFKNPKLIFFAPLFSTPDEKKCRREKEKYDFWTRFEFPQKIQSSFVAEKKKTFGLSAGKAAGKLQNLSFFQKKKTGKIILFTKILSPEIAAHFDQIAGIVSENGGLLSHLAIVAREQKIPVIAGFSLGKMGINLGDLVKIDGKTGKIEKEK